MRRRSTTRIINENPAAHSNWLSLCTFWYTIKIFKVGLKRDFTEDDLTEPLDKHRSGRLGRQLSIYWMQEVEKARRGRRQPGMLIPLVKCFGLEILLYGFILLMMELGCRIYQPLFIGLILRYFSAPNAENKIPWRQPVYVARVFNYWEPNQCAIDKNEVYVFAFFTILCSLVATLVIHPMFTMLNFVGMKIRIAVCSLIYRKILRLDSRELNGKMIGNVINILSNDVNKFDNLHFIHYIWLGPMTVMWSLYFIYKEINYCAFIGMGPVMFCIPLQIVLGFMTKYLRIETAIRTDNRVQVMNEIIQGIRVIKMYAWEYAFSESLHKTRKHEMHSLIKASVIKGVMMSLILFTTRAGHCLSTLFYLRSSDHITIEQVFYIISFYQILRMTMTVYFPQGVGHVSEIYVAVRRVKDFLLLSETDIANPEPMDPNWLKKVDSVAAYKTYYNKYFVFEDNPQVFLQNASLKYDKATVLENITLQVLPGELTAIIGPVGSGKSVLLYMILGELKPFEGTADVKGVISYASQDPFLFAGTVRQNILFGTEYDKTRYNEVIRKCALIRDFTLLPFGDQTMVGEKGISLSGGQRARINLARAVYREADIYLLDDPLSAVDTNVGKQLFEDCICGYLKKKVVILTTHQWQYLKPIDQIMFLEDGRVKHMGNYHTVFASTDLAKLIPAEGDDATVELPEKQLEQAGIKKVKSGVSSALKMKKQLASQKEYEEMRGSGVIGCEVLFNYYRSGGNHFFIFLLFFAFIATQAAASVFDFFMSIWSRIEDQNVHKKAINPIPEMFSSLTRGDCEKYASIFIISTMVTALGRSFYFYGFCMRASINLHNRMFKSVTRANLRFFTLNASGRILNRFSKDMGAVDEMLPYAMVDTYQILLNFVGVIWLLVLINLYLLIFTCLVTLVFYIIRKYYLTASCSLKRLEGVGEYETVDNLQTKLIFQREFTRSPVFTHTNATMQGLAVIRSHGNEDVLVEEFDKFQDTHTSASFMFMAVSRAFGYVLDLCTVVYTTVIIYYFLFDDSGGGANVALILTQCIGLTGIFQWGMRQSAEFETQLTAVERVLEFTTLEPEPALESAPGQKPEESWPANGELTLRHLFMRYSLTEQPVLRNFSCEIKSEEKIGIVGRTGAGKSSIIQSLFRLAYVEGDIIIDEVDTAFIGLHDLRKKISIIPQEPVIFSGTLRYNLDPFKEYNDLVLYSALVDVDLKLAVSVDCLNEYMSDGGVNLSVGSRQLVCLARAIVRNNKILILDEATANVDLMTDNSIQHTIRKKFSNCTVLTIAHRLNTIMDSDKVLVMDSGQVIEFDHPYLLMKQKDSIFAELISKTGRQNVQKFMEIAKASYDEKTRTVPSTS